MGIGWWTLSNILVAAVPGTAGSRQGVARAEKGLKNVAACAAFIAMIIAILTGASPGAAAPAGATPPAQTSSSSTAAAE
jgi:hypothetical protein